MLLQVIQDTCATCKTEVVWFLCFCKAHHAWRVQVTDGQRNLIFKLFLMPIQHVWRQWHFVFLYFLVFFWFFFSWSLFFLLIVCLPSDPEHFTCISFLLLFLCLFSLFVFLCWLFLILVSFFTLIRLQHPYLYQTTFHLNAFDLSLLYIGLYFSVLFVCVCICVCV